MMTVYGVENPAPTFNLEKPERSWQETLYKRLPVKRSQRTSYLNPQHGFVSFKHLASHPAYKAWWAAKSMIWQGNTKRSA